ncbi:hypothetical protein IW261DRAFT_1468778 [Armillaria novae-zelandiae]|uniref:ubiquitinyl hydrolase 1 n=1 Tax=Armillaria novae-zelandiae TaxID=153914 RepID=A0AA39TE02_9AGAR|nr:hypothetical protein IW261DRAFT_1468778 [Armillaria novae-zelandiae]
MSHLSSYPPSGSGPSNYYARSPPPTMMYGTNNAGNGSFPYQYAGSISPHMPHAPMNGRGRGSYSHHASTRGGHNAQSYSPHPAPSFAPIPPQPTHSQPPVPHSIPHHSGPYPPSFSPSYPYPQPPPSGAYPQQWQTQQPLSPLPKQLSMPPPNTAIPVSSHIPQISTEDPNVDTQSAPPMSPSALPLTPTSPLTNAAQPLSPSSPSIPSQRLPNALPEWVIWSKRPHDPSNAPGIIFSPRANPPAHIVRDALPIPPPPESPPVTSEALSQPVSLPEESREESLNDDASDGLLQDSSSSSSHATSTVPSSSATEITDTPTLPGSPVSTNTSVSLPDAPNSTKPLETADPTEENSSVATAETTPTTVKVSPAPVKKTWASLLQTPPSAGSSTSKNALPTSTVLGFSIPASAQAPVLPSKKPDLIALLTTGPTAKNAPSTSKLTPRGLINTGNMCFANSVLQILLYCPPFFKLFYELGRLVGTGSKILSEAHLTEATMTFLKEFFEEEKEEEKNAGSSTTARGKGKEKMTVNDDDWERESFIPTYVYDALKEKKRFDHMRGGHQEDAEEFLGFYLDTLEEELLSVLQSITSQNNSGHTLIEEKEEDTPTQDDGWLEVGKRNRSVVTRTIKNTESPITRVFGGKFRSTLRAPGQKDSVIIEDWRAIRLDIQPDHIHTIEDALSYISHPQSVQMSLPTRPGVAVEASQQVLIEALPPILILHIKRFHFDTEFSGVMKVGKQVRFGPELEIGPELMSPTVRKSQGVRYMLFGAVYHHGVSASGGHYTLDVLHPHRYPSFSPNVKPREGWIRIDDELVSDVRNEDVFDAWDRDDARTAYLLFYRRVR